MKRKKRINLLCVLAVLAGSITAGAAGETAEALYASAADTIEESLDETADKAALFSLDAVPYAGTNSYEAGGGTANGKYAVAIGDSASAGSDVDSANAAHAVAVGAYSNASGIGATAVGSGAAAGEEGSAFGASSSAADSGVAVGSGAAAEEDAVAVGAGSRTTKSGAVSVGFGASSGGKQALAVGYLTQADGDNAAAIGNSAVASAENSMAIGSKSKVYGANSVALGSGTSVLSENAVAIGTGTSVADSAQYGIAMGYETSASGERAIAIGFTAKAAYNHAIALGDSASASANQSIAIGTAARVNEAGSQSIALGLASSAQAAGALALGRTATVTGDRGISIGYNAASSDTAAIAIGGSEGEWEAAKASGKYSIALGTGASADGENGVAIGAQSSSSGVGAIAIGVREASMNRLTAASGKNSIALGAGAQATAESGIVLGTLALVESDYAIAIGGAVYGNASHGIAIGYSSSSSADMAISIGNNVSVSGTSSVGLGNSYSISGRNSIAIGNGGGAWAVSDNDVVVIGHEGRISRDGAVAIGTRTYAGSNAIAIGTDAATSGDNGVAIGRRAVVWNNGVALGSNSTATGTGSAAIGDGSKAWEANVVSFGYGAENSDGYAVTRRLINVSDGTEATDAATYGQLQSVQSELKQADTALQTSLSAAERQISTLETNTAGITHTEAGTVIEGTVAVSTAGEITGVQSLNGAVIGADTFNGAAISENSFNGVTIGTNQVNGVHLLDGNISQVGSLTTAGGLSLTAGNKITGLANGALTSTSTEAVTGGQLYTVQTELEEKFSELETSIDRDTTALSDRIGTLETNTAGIAHTEAGTVIEGKVAVSTAGEITGVQSLNGAVIGADTFNGAAISENSFNGVTIGTNQVNGVHLLDGNISQVGSLTTAGGLSLTAGNKITGLANGALTSTSTEAVTGGQLYTVQTELEKQISDLETSAGSDTAALSNRVRTLETNTAAITHTEAGTAVAGNIAVAGEVTGASFNGVTLEISEVSATKGDVIVGGINLTDLNQAIYGGEESSLDLPARMKRVEGKLTRIDYENGTTTIGTVEIDNDGVLRQVASLSTQGGLSLTAENKIVGLADGALADGSTEAVTGGQLYTVRTDLEQRLEDLKLSVDGDTAGLADRVGALETAGTDISYDQAAQTTTVGGVQFSGGTIRTEGAVYASSFNGVTLDVANTRSADGDILVGGINLSEMRRSLYGEGESGDGEESLTERVAQLEGTLTGVAYNADTKTTAIAGNLTVGGTINSVSLGRSEAGNILLGDVDITQMRQDVDSLINGETIAGGTVHDSVSKTDEDGNTTKTEVITKEDGLYIKTEETDKDGGTTSYKEWNVGESLDSLGEQISQTNEEVGRLTGRVNEMDYRISDVGAMAAAMSSLKTLGYNPAAPTEISAGIGHYDGHTAYALGIFHNANENLLFNAQYAAAGSRETMISGGFTVRIGSGTSGSYALADKKLSEEELQKLISKQVEERTKQMQKEWQAKEEALMQERQQHQAELARLQQAQADTLLEIQQKQAEVLKKLEDRLEEAENRKGIFF